MGASAAPYLALDQLVPVVLDMVIYRVAHTKSSLLLHHRLKTMIDITLQELYYPPFKGAVDAGLHSIMCS